MTNGYMRGVDWVIYDGSTTWYMFEYDSGASNFTILYDKTGLNLNGSSNDWQLVSDPNQGSTPTTICPQIPFSQSFTVGAGAVTNIPIPYAAMITNYDIIGTNGIHITASQPVSVYGFDYYAAASVAFTGYPTTLLGTNYCVMAYPGFTGYPSEFSIVATADDTTVWITPSTNADLEGYDGTIYTNAYSETLNQGQTYQIGSANGGDDVTGTSITSDKPIAVFAGANVADVPVGVPAANPLVQEQLPVEQWGTNVVALSFAGRFNGDSYRVLAYTNTTVTITNSFGISIVTNLTAGTFCETNLDGWVWFQADHPNSSGAICKWI